MIEDSDFWSLPPLTILCWRTHLVTTRHPEDGHGIAQMDKTTSRLITFYWGSASDQEWTLPEHAVFQVQTFEVITTCWWWPSAFSWKKISEPKHTRLKFDLEAEYPPMAFSFRYNKKECYRVSRRKTHSIQGASAPSVCTKPHLAPGSSEFHIKKLGTTQDTEETAANWAFGWPLGWSARKTQFCTCLHGLVLSGSRHV